MSQDCEADKTIRSLLWAHSTTVLTLILFDNNYVLCHITCEYAPVKLRKKLLLLSQLAPNES